MSKPELGKVLEIIRLKAEAKELYKKVDLLMSGLAKEHGDGRFDYDLGTPDENGKQFMVFNVIDNIKAMQEGKEIFTSASIKPLTFETRMNKTNTSKKK